MVKSKIRYQFIRYMYACFISYPHPKQGKQFEKIIDQLIKALEDYLGFFIGERV